MARLSRKRIRAARSRRLARLSPAEVLEEEDWFDFDAGYVSDDLILVGSVEQHIHLLVAADTLATFGRIEYPSGHTRECITASGRGTWLTSEYMSGRHELWRLVEQA